MSSRLTLAVVCFPTFGGSGVIATEIGLGMAARGHRVHFVARDLPVRLPEASRDRVSDVLFHEVAESDYPALVGSSSYPLVLASKLIELCTFENVDVIHVHYAVPHATAAWMAREVLRAGLPAARVPRIVTTLHGTDITLVGSDLTHLPITRHSIMQSDAVTTPSQYLRDVTYARLDIPATVTIDVIGNFVDAQLYRPSSDRGALLALFADAPADELAEDAVLFHVSNFRGVKRVLDVVDVFAAVAANARTRLVMVGDGPDRSAAERRVRELGLAGRVAFLGKRKDFVELLAAADVFLLPSESESFGLAALEAASCGVPTVASDVGGIPEVVVHGTTGMLAPVGDVAGMATHVLALLRDRSRRAAMATAARDRVLARFQAAPAIDRYLALYRRVLAKGS